MATKKRHHKRKKHRAMSEPGKRKHTRRRRRMGAGSGAFKIMSDPLFGSLIGAGAGLIVKNIVAGFIKDEKMKIIASAVPVVGGIALRKKMPFIAGGMFATPVLTAIGNLKNASGSPLVPFLHENGNISFADETLLSAETELSETLVLSDQSYSLNEMEAPAYSDYSVMDEE